MRVVIWIGLVLLGVVLAVLVWAYHSDKPRAELEAQYAAPPSQFIESGGVRFHVRDTGPKEGPAVLFLHGFGSSLHTWEDWATSLQDRFRVIRVDLPGFGLTGADPSGDYRDPHTLALLKDLLDRLGVETAVLAGNSMGGRMAWRFAAAYPERVTKLVLVSPDGFASPGRGYGELPKVPLSLSLLPYFLPVPLVRISILPAYHDKSVLTDALLSRYCDMMLAPGVRRAILARTAQDVLVDPVPLLSTIKVPTLLLWGDKDALIPITNAADYLRVMPDARLVTLVNVGHVPQEEIPGESLRPLRAFLEE